MLGRLSGLGGRPGQTFQGLVQLRGGPKLGIFEDVIPLCISLGRPDRAEYAEAVR